jgi:hypothetical protein
MNEEEKKERESKISNMLSALAICKEDAKAKGLKRGKGGRGQVICPRCGKSLHYSVASVNGHMWGRCETSGCVSWME